LRKFDVTADRWNTFTTADFWRFESGLPALEKLKHFIIINKNGDATNRPTFDYDSSTGTFYDSTDGITWTPRTGTFALKTWWGRPIKLVSEDKFSRGKYRLLEDTFYDPRIAKRETMEQLLQGRLDISAKKYRTYKTIRVTTLPDVPPLPLQGLTVADQFQGLEEFVVIRRVTYEVTMGSDADIGISECRIDLEEAVD